MLRQERYSGVMQRSFYIGDHLSEEDVKASYESGVLHIKFRKKEALKAPEKKTILIEANTSPCRHTRQGVLKEKRRTRPAGQRFAVLICLELFEKFRFGQTGKRLTIRKAAAEGEHVSPGVFDDGGKA